MAEPQPAQDLDEAFERIEETILPSLSMVIDSLIEAASLARPGHDAEVYAAELRTLGCELEALTRAVEALHDQADQAPERARISA
ncbi:MAG: hypothetical protein ACJ8DZ_03015 [Allosphingosinicella sp.]|jgi:hypothetical protein